MKLYYMPTTGFGAVATFEESGDFAFSAMPMPYDITVNPKGAGTKEVVYNIEEVVNRLLDQQNSHAQAQGQDIDAQITQSA